MTDFSFQVSKRKNVIINIKWNCMYSTYNEIFQFENRGFGVCYTSERKTYKSSKIKDIKK